MTIEADIITPATASRALCAHCGQVVPPGLIDRNAANQFCCGGCEAVYEAIHACGLDSYYRLRDAASASTKPAEVSKGSFEAFDSPSFAESFIEFRDGMASVDLVLQGVTCAACVWLVERLPRVLDGVIDARLSLREATVRVRWDPKQVSLSRIARTLARFGYTAHPARGRDARELHRRETRHRLVHLGIAGAIMGNSMLLGLALYAGDYGTMDAKYRIALRALSALLGIVSLAWPGAVFFRSAYAAIRTRTTNIDVPIALALLVGGVAGLCNVILNRGEIYFDSLTVLVFLLLIGRFVQYRQQRRADDAVGLLFSMTPATCRIIRDGRVIESPIEAMLVDDVVEVRAGELFPADGVVQSGRSSVNQALLTGESRPIAVELDSLVHAGSQNIASTLCVRVTCVGPQTRVARLMGLIEQGVRDKPPIVQFTDTVGGWFIVVVSLAAAGVFAYWARFSVHAAIDHAVALLIVTCPCVLGLATPLTIAIAIGRLARRDILVKSGAALERLSRSGHILLDKTGTITEGQVKLVRWVGDNAVQGIVARLEGQSNHPIGRALHQSLETRAISSDIADVVERGDGGIEGRLDGAIIRAGSLTYMNRHGVDFDVELLRKIDSMQREGLSVVVVARGDEAIAAAGLTDQVADGSAAAIKALRKHRWTPYILSGDSNAVVANVARAVGIDESRATGEVTPEQKLARVNQRGRGVTVMVGDGVNDSAALAAADVGIAVHGGADASLAAADVYIARPGLTPLVELIETSRLAMWTIRRNLAVSLGYNLLAGVLAATGIMTPMIGAILMPISSATVLSLAASSICRKRRGESWK